MLKLLIIDESEDTVSDSNEEENESIHSNSSLEEEFDENYSSFGSESDYSDD